MPSPSLDTRSHQCATCLCNQRTLASYHELDHWHYLRMFNKESAMSHSNDLMDCLRPVVDSSKKKAFVMVVDNGPDWCRHSVMTVLVMGRVWEYMDLDYLLLTSYAPGDSKFNPIEHAWAAITRWCSGLVLHNSLEGESTCPLFCV